MGAKAWIIYQEQNLPGDNLVKNGADEDNDANKVRETIPENKNNDKRGQERDRLQPANRVPVESDGVLCREGANCNNQGDVEHGRPNNTTHSYVILG